MKLLDVIQKRDRFLAAHIFLIVLLFYWRLVGFQFLNFDDPGYVTRNPWVSNGLSISGVDWAFSTFAEGHWHPLTWLSHMLDVSIFGMNPAGHHFVNLFLFSLNASLVFLFLRKLAFNEMWAFCGVLFFSLNPLRLETVAWVAERKDVLSFFFGILSLLFFVSGSWEKKRYSISLSFVCFVLSLMAKPTFISLPLLLVLLDHYRGWDWRQKVFWKNKAAFFGVALISAIISVIAQREAHALRSLDLLSRLETTVMSYGAYLGKFFFPLQTSIFYPYEKFFPGVASGVFVGLFAISCYLYQRRNVDKLMWLGWLWFLITSLPVSGLVTIGGQIFADRWTYLPHLGILMGALSFCNRSKLRSIVRAVAMAAVAFLSFKTIPEWKDSESIFRHALKTTPDNFMAHNNLGTALEEIGNFKEADEHYEEAVRLNPTYAEAINNLGIARMRQSRIEEAIHLFQRALQIDPSLLVARQNLDLALQEARKTP
jgi:tetratricopeptide (TPR) repeat protein